MSGRIDVANYENQHMLNNMRKKLRAAVAKEDEDAMGCSGRVGTVRGILTSEEIDLLHYINDDFKLLLIKGCKGRAEANKNHLSRIMSLADAMKCVNLGSGSYGGHIARETKAPGPINGHNTIQPHEKYIQPILQ